MAMLQLMTVIVRNLPADDSGFRRVPLRLSMTGEEQRTMVPVDWVAEAIARLLDLPCPVIDEAMIHRFLAHGDADNWGRRRRKARRAVGNAASQPVSEWK